MLETYYKVRVVRDEELYKECGINASTVTLLTASEDGYETFAVLNNLDPEEKEAVVTAWQGGKHHLIMAVVKGLRSTVIPMEDSDD